MPTTNNIPTGPHFISLSQAVIMTTAYRANKQSILDGSYQNMDILPMSETWNRSAIDTLLAIPGCVAIRSYLSMDETGKVHTILVAVNSNNEDIILPPAENETEEDYIVEEAQWCPPLCPPTSPLNS